MNQEIEVHSFLKVTAHRDRVNKKAFGILDFGETTLRVLCAVMATKL